MPYQHYPEVIQQAVLLVESHPSITLVLTRAYRRVLKALVTRCSRKDGTEPVQAKMERLAEEADTSEKTVQRALRDMAKLGWIEQVGDGRDNDGKYDVRDFKILPGLCALLRLPVPKILAQQTKMSDGLYIDLQLKEDQSRIEEKKPKTEADIELPAELDYLPEELGVKRSAIAMLRGQAHRAGYNLAHIVACARRYLKAQAITGNRVTNYLRSMISKPGIDYAARAAQEGRVAVAADFEARAISAARKHAGKAYVEPDGHTYRFCADGRVEILDGGRMLGFLPVDQVEQLAQLVADGKLLEASATRPVASAAAPCLPAPGAPVASESVRRSHLAAAFGILKGKVRLGC